MKKIILYLNLIVLFISMSLVANAVPDPAVLGAIISPTPAQWPRISPDQYETFSFQIINNGSRTNSALVKVEVTLTNLDFDQAYDESIHITHTKGETSFTFAWNASTKKLTCTLNGDFQQFAGNTFTINKLVLQTGSPKPNNLVGGSAKVLLAKGTLNNSIINDLTETYTFTSTRITGSLWDDTDGNAAKGTSEDLITSGILWANLVNTSVDTVQYSVQVDASGNYLFNLVDPATNFKIILTTTPQTTGAHLTIADQPAGWIATGVNQDGVHDIDNKTGVLYLLSSADNYLNQNFGLEQPPTAQNKSASYPVAVRDDRYMLSPNAALAPQPALSGTDPEEGTLGTGNKFIITSLPTDAKLFYDGVEIKPTDVTNGTGPALISSYNPDLLEFSSNMLGILVTSFTYVSVDAAGAKSPAATYSINASGVLPVTGLQLKATLSSLVPYLSWSTLSEEGTSYFEVQSSVDGTHYNKIGTVSAAGNSTTAKTYDFKDVAISSNTAVYYRIVLFGKDGKKITSNTVVLIFKKDIDISIFPNPAQKFIMVKGIAENAKIAIIDSKGRVMQTQSGTGTSRQLQLFGYAAGTYFIQVIENNKLITTKMFIKD